jgi:hypothetical protein
MKDTFEFLKYSATAATLAVGSALLGTAVYDLVKGSSPEQLVMIGAAGLFLFLGAFYIGLRLARGVIHSSARPVKAYTQYRRRVLIMGLSKANAARGEGPDGIESFDILCREPRIRLHASEEEFGKLCKSVYPNSKTAPSTNSQQNVRAIHNLLPDLTHVYILPSRESLKQLPEFLAGAKLLFPEIRFVPVFCYPEDSGSDDPDRNMDYEKSEYVHDGLKTAIAMASEDHRVAALPSDICIDATAGQKTFSIASAIVTMNNEILLSYVTNEGKPKYYDMSASFGGTSV